MSSLEPTTNNEKDFVPKGDKDVASVHTANGADKYLESQDTKLARQLKSRHIAMISIGGVIGTGLFIGTASSLASGGPVGLLLGYTIMGTICYSVMISLGEMVAYLPLPGGHIMLAERFVDPALSFAMGWNYWYNWTVVMPAELSAAAIIFGFWRPDVNPAAWISLCIALVVAINLLGAGAYGEAEFIFASVKVITITGLIILGIVLDLGGGPDHDRLGFRYWKNPGPFAQFLNISGAKGQFLGFFSVLSQAAFSFIGTEIVAITAGEAKNPRRNIPRAIKRVYIRILLFYILGTFVIGLLVPYNDPDLTKGFKTAAGSPFVIAIQRSGIQALPSIVNACLLTSAWSAASSDLYTSSRALYGLAVAGNAPRFFALTTKRGLPWVSMILCIAFTALSYMAVNKGANKVFGWFVNMTSNAGLVTWLGICITYIRFHAGWKAQGIDRSLLPFKSSLQPYAAWYALISCTILMFFSGFQVFLAGQWAADQFVTTYLPVALFPILYFGYRLAVRCQSIKASHMDFFTGIDIVEAATVDEPPPRNFVEKFWSWLM